MRGHVVSHTKKKASFQTWRRLDCLLCRMYKRKMNVHETIINCF